ncbi:hypothetical protein SEA_MAGRITTE_176 [Microbacterium phage Magritte]|nr:hypothetical protein SEA_MAGRITTE_176 [Microbacterium phage Magritte]
MIEHEHTPACDKTTGLEEIRLRRAVEAADRDRKAREYAQAYGAAQTPAERAADEAERQRLREMMNDSPDFSTPKPDLTDVPFTLVGFNEAIAQQRIDAALADWDDGAHDAYREDD